MEIALSRLSNGIYKGRAIIAEAGAFSVEGSFFVSSTAVNPALTIMANALRVADHILERLG